MSVLVRLYPRPWRERYEAEFLALLEAHPPSVGDRLDIVRGAIDAHRLGSDGPEAGRLGPPLVSRLPGAIVVVGAVFWILAIGALAVAPTSPDGYVDGEAATLLLVTSLLALAIGLALALEDLPATVGRTPMRGLAAFGIALGLLIGLPWDLKAVPWLVVVVLLFGGGIRLAATQADQGRVGSWAPAAVALASISLVTIGLASATGLLQGDLLGLPSGAVVVSSLPTGLAWLAVGLSLARRARPDLDLAFRSEDSA